MKKIAKGYIRFLLLFFLFFQILGTPACQGAPELSLREFAKETDAPAPLLTLLERQIPPGFPPGSYAAAYQGWEGYFSLLPPDEAASLPNPPAALRRAETRSFERALQKILEDQELFRKFRFPSGSASSSASSGQAADPPGKRSGSLETKRLSRGYALEFTAAPSGEPFHELSFSGSSFPGGAPPEIPGALPPGGPQTPARGEFPKGFILLSGVAFPLSLGTFHPLSSGILRSSFGKPQLSGSPGASGKTCQTTLAHPDGGREIRSSPSLGTKLPTLLGIEDLQVTTWTPNRLRLVPTSAICFRGDYKEISGKE